MNHSAPYGIIDPDYARIFTIARCLAWAEGYALAMHGSFTRDLDLIAIPWAPHACEPEHLARRIEDVAGLRISVEPKDDKPHGRLVWTMTLPAFADPRFVDLSIIPPPKSGMISRPDLLRALQKQRDAFVHENFSYDPDTGFHESSVANEEHLEGLDERIKFIASFQAVAETDAAAPGDTGLLVGASSEPLSTKPLVGEGVQGRIPDCGQCNEQASQCLSDPSRDELIESIQYAEAAISAHLEEFHDFEYAPHDVPPEVASLRGIQHHLAGSLIDTNGSFISPSSTSATATETDGGDANG